MQQVLVKVHRRWAHIASAESPYAYTRAAQVVAPAAAWVQLVSSAPSLYPDSAKVDVTDGTAVLTTPAWSGQDSPYRVSAYYLDGTLIGTWPLELPNLADPYDLRP